MAFYKHQIAALGGVVVSKLDLQIFKWKFESHLFYHKHNIKIKYPFERQRLYSFEIG